MLSGALLIQCSDSKMPEYVETQRVLEHGNGSVGKSVTLLGISRKSLWEKIKRMGQSVRFCRIQPWSQRA